MRLRLIVDTNILFSAIVKDSFTRKILTHLDVDLFTIDFSNDELRKYKDLMLKKSELDSDEFDRLIEKLLSRIQLIDDYPISLRMPEALTIMRDIDIKDSPFIAAALSVDADIWSDDNHFVKQDRVKIWKTIDLAKFL